MPLPRTLQHHSLGTKDVALQKHVALWNMGRQNSAKCQIQSSDQFARHCSNECIAILYMFITFIHYIFRCTIHRVGAGFQLMLWDYQNLKNDGGKNNLILGWSPVVKRQSLEVPLEWPEINLCHLTAWGKKNLQKRITFGKLTSLTVHKITHSWPLCRNGIDIHKSCTIQIQSLSTDMRLSKGIQEGMSSKASHFIFTEYGRKHEVKGSRAEYN